MANNGPGVVSDDEVFEGFSSDDEVSANTKESPKEEETTAVKSLMLDSSWLNLHLSKGLLKAVERLGYETPTPIQREAIPRILQGRDIFAMAETGSGKTCAFLLPLIERLLQSPAVKSRRYTSASGSRVTKVLIIVPTRELARQCFEVCCSFTEKLAITQTLIFGGASLNEQETQLRRQPDIVICTPGRCLDLLMNSKSISMELLEIVVLDEADKLIELGFQDECLNILKLCSRQRQTLVFSATLSASMETQFVSLAMKNPVKVFGSSAFTKELKIPESIDQLFVKLPSANATDREAALMYLVQRVYQDSTMMVFFATKAEAHRMYILFLTLDRAFTENKLIELHGNLSQAQRAEGFKKFANREATIMFTTDLSARGLDIPDLQVVINFDPPTDEVRYIHRAGRTGRAGAKGLCVTMYAPEQRQDIRKMWKKCTKKSSEANIFKAMQVPSKLIKKFSDKILSAEDDVKSQLEIEKAERELARAEIKIRRAHNNTEFKELIRARPKRSYIEKPSQSKSQKKRKSHAQA